MSTDIRFFDFFFLLLFKSQTFSNGSLKTIVRILILLKTNLELKQVKEFRGLIHSLQRYVHMYYISAAQSCWCSVSCRTVLGLVIALSQLK